MPENRLADLREEEARLTKKLRKLRSRIHSSLYPKEPEGAHPVIRFKKRYPLGTQIYVYAAVKVEDRWYLTGAVHGSTPYTWTQLIDFIRKDNVPSLLQFDPIRLGSLDEVVRLVGWRS